MKSVKVFFYPLVACVLGFVILMIFLMFRGVVSNTTTQMAANVTAAHPAVATQITLWGIMSSGPAVVLLCVLIIIGFILWYMFKDWIKSRLGG